jgi:hypothetical protein
LDNGIKVKAGRSVIQIGPIGSRQDTMIVFNCETGIYIWAGCFRDRIDLFEVAIGETHGDNEHAREYRAACALIREMFK